MTRFPSLLLIPLALAAGCSTAVQSGHTAPPATPGYALLYKLMSQESDVDKLLMIKHVDPPIPALIQEIAAASQKAAGQLRDFASHDPSLNLNDTGLPDIETRTRDAIESTESHELLFTSGHNFEARLLFTQADGTNYAAHLARVINENEHNPVRKQLLAAVEKQSTDFYARILILLAKSPGK